MFKNELNLPQESINTCYASFSKATPNTTEKNLRIQSKFFLWFLFNFLLLKKHVYLIRDSLSTVGSSRTMNTEQHNDV